MNAKSSSRSRWGQVLDSRFNAANWVSSSAASCVAWWGETTTGLTEEDGARSSSSGEQAHVHLHVRVVVLCWCRNDVERTTRPTCKCNQLQVMVFVI
jgi:lysophospholipase L1-like esterase